MKRKIRFAALVCAASLLMSLISGGFAFGFEEAEDDPYEKLEVVGTEERFRELLEENSYGGEILYEEESAMNTTAVAGIAPAARPAPQATSAPGGGDFSQTNTQVAGVDEADLIKTDGKYIYFVQNDILHVIETDDGKMEPVFSQAFDNFFPNELYLDDGYLIAVGHRVIVSRTSNYNYRYYTTKEYATAYVYDVKDKTDIQKIREITIDGSCLSSRKIGDTLYLISKKNYYYSDPLPFYRDSIISGADIAVPYENMYIIPGGGNTSVMFIATLDLSENDKAADIQSFVGSSNIMYMSLENMYLSQQAYGRSERETKLYKFALEKDTVSYVMRGKVKGHIINQFSMDENGGYLRIATTDNTANNLFILDENLKTVGAIKDIARGERIYSVRFLGDKGYVVTFKQTDPLFAFDLSDPLNPKLLGALKIPGYSTYLHPYAENYLIGFGQDTEVLKNGAVIATGLKMSMFDVTDMTDPKELFVEYLGDRGSNSPLLNDHKAILQSTEKDIFAFPAHEYRIAEGYSNSNYGSLYQQGAFVYSIDMETGFELRGVITHKPSEELLKSSHLSANPKTDVTRIIYIGDVFYTISGDRIQSNKIGDLSLIDTAKIN